MTIDERDKYAYELMVKNNPDETVKQLLLKDKIINELQQRISKAIEYIGKNIELNNGALSNREELIVSKHDLIKNETDVLNYLINILKGEENVKN